MIEIKNLKKRFGKNEVLKGVNLNIEKGKTTFIIGSSGCGKSVILKHIIGHLKPDEGEILIDGEDITKMDDKELYRIRNKFGFLFQGAALFDSMTIAENVGLSLFENTDKPRDEVNAIVKEMLGLVDLEGIENMKPSELSGGEQQRIAVARALANSPDIIFADEPTGNLDSVNSEALHKLFVKLRDELKVTFLIVTHNQRLVGLGDKVFEMKDGVIH